MSYFDYLQTNSDRDCFFIVTEYGCNSTPSDLWTPLSKMFNNFQDAYNYFLQVSPDVNDTDNETIKYICNFDISDKNKKYVVIENIVQSAGYHSGGPGNYAKRPCGTVIARMCF